MRGRKKNEIKTNSYLTFFFNKNGIKLPSKESNKCQFYFYFVCFYEQYCCTDKTHTLCQDTQGPPKKKRGSSGLVEERGGRGGGGVKVTFF